MTNTGRPTVARVETFPLEAVLPDGGYGASKVLLPARVCTIVKITTSDGVVGWGESFGPPRLTAAHFAAYARTLVGRPVDVRESFLLDALSAGYQFTSGGLHIAALSGLDIALWDAQARAFGVPVGQLLGGMVRDSVPAYASTGYMTATRDPGLFRDQIRQSVEEGFTAAKVKIGSGPAEDRERAQITRDAIGDTGVLMVDYNANATVDVVIRSLMTITDLDPYWVEEPLPPDDHTGWDHVRRTGIPIAAGESLYTRFGFRDVIAERRVDIVQPDLTKCGGFTEAKAIAQNTVAWNLRVSPHCWGTGLAQAATLQLLSTLPNAPFGQTGTPPHYLEFDRGHNPLREGVLVEPIRAIDGRVAIPTGPGLGVEIDEDYLRATTLHDHRVDTDGQP
jgi:D-galactarolactone cycloisomerase